MRFSSRLTARGFWHQWVQQRLGPTYTDKYLLLIQDSGVAGHPALYLAARVEETPGNSRPRDPGLFSAEQQASPRLRHTQDPIQKAAKPVATVRLPSVTGSNAKSEKVKNKKEEEISR